jgi:hypothetical protein
MQEKKENSGAIPQHQLLGFLNVKRHHHQVWNGVRGLDAWLKLTF